MARARKTGKLPITQLRRRKSELQQKAKGEKKLTKSELRELRQINLALTLRKFPRRGKGRSKGEKWIAGAIKRPGALRRRYGYTPRIVRRKRRRVTKRA